MKKLSKTLLMSPAVSLVLPAALFVSFNSAYASLVDTSQNQTFESRPQAAAVSKRPVSSPFIKLAAVHFLGNDWKTSFGNQEFLPEDICKQGGYTHKGCPAGYVKGEACPEDGSYVKDCIDPDTWCKNNGYEVTGCQVPQYPQGACPYGSGYYKSCETDNIRACKELGYSLTCEAGKVGDTNQSCPYNESYKKCVCSPCGGYGYTASEANAQGYTPGEVCNSCGTMKYKRSANACDGFKECTDGGAAGAEVCYSGSLKKFSECKEVCDPKFQYDSSNCTGNKVLAGNSCGGKYEQCKDYNDPNYVFTCDDEDYINNNLNKFSSAPYLYSDGTVSTQILSGKKPIGIVVDAEQRLAVALKRNQTAWFGTKEYAAWKNLDSQGKGYGDIAEEYFRYADIPALAKCLPYSYQGGDKCDPDGYENTKKLIEFAESNGIELPAVDYVKNYSPDNVSVPAAWFAKGKWFLPSLNQMYLIFDPKNILADYVARRRIGNTKVAYYTSLCSQTYWTSNRTGSTISWFVGSNTGNYWGYYKSISTVAALPMIKY